MHAALIVAASLFLQGTPPARTVYPYARQPTPLAYFILQASDMDGTSDWPFEFKKFSLMVANASISASPGLERANSIPDNLLLAYRNFSDIEVANSRSGSFWDSLEVRFDTTFCIRDLDDGGRCVRMGLPDDTIPTWVPFPASIDAFMDHYDTFIATKNFDGVYLDEFTNPYPAWRWALLPTNYDIDGDGVTDDSLKFVSQREAGRELLSQRLRASMGGTKILIGNSAGATTPAGYFNGITIEAVSDSLSVLEAIADLDAQRAVSIPPYVNVVWVTNTDQEESSVSVVRARDRVWLGTTIHP